MKTTRRRWSDEQSSFWFLTYSPDKHSKPFGVVLDSGSDDYPGCHLRLRGFGHTLIVECPPLLRPWRQKIMASTWDAETVARMGRDWYWNEHPREYGFQISNGGFFRVFFGAQTDDSATDRSWSWLLPFTQWRYVRVSLYDTEGRHFWTQLDSAPSRGLDRIREEIAVEERCPAVWFAFDDFDGERITVRTYIEEREWRFGEGWFRWLSAFRPPKVHRSLDLQFSKETGQRKGSWKGGTLGHAITLQPGELHESAFRRYCAEHQMTFIGPSPPPNTELSQCGPQQASAAPPP